FPADLEVGNPVALAKVLMQLKAEGVNLEFPTARSIKMEFEVPRRRKAGPPSAELAHQHVNAVKGDYARFLRQLLQKHSFARDSIGVRPTDPRSAAPPKLPDNKGPAYERLAFSVSGQAARDQVWDMLREFYATPLLHQIYSLTLEQPPEKETKKDPK